MTLEDLPFSMLTRIALSVLLLLVGAAAGAQEEIESPFFLPTPGEWSTEVIPFPLEFAPELEYEGLEELRFAPGMFEEGRSDFWSYAFVWWVPEETELDTDRLESDLESYFRGLTRAVAESRDFDAGEPRFEVNLAPSAPQSGSWLGTALTFDAFVTRRPVELRVRIDTIPCPSQGHLAAFFQLSPQPAEHEIWRTLGELRDGFRCDHASR